MKRLVIKRESFDPDATIGRFYCMDGDKVEFDGYTLENPMVDLDYDGVNDNTQNKSCIYAGTYNARFLSETASGKYKRTGVYWLQNVEGRNGVLVHPGNSASDTLGCIIPGDRHALLDGVNFVYNSVNTMKKMVEVLGKGSIELQINNN